MESDMEKQGGKRRQEEDGDDGEACYLDGDAESNRRSKRARNQLEANIPTEQGDIISQLHDLPQNRIFGLLGVRDKVQAAQVCSTWRNAVYRPCQWREVTVRLDVDKLSEEDVSSLQERKIRHLQVNNFHVESNIVHMLRDSLVSLNLIQTPLPLSVLQTVFCKRFISLRKLCVCTSNAEPLEFQIMQDVFWHFSNLEHLDLIVDECDTGVGQAVGRNLKSLKHFSLIASGHAACNLEFLDHLSNLQSLSLNKVDLSGTDYLKSSCKTLKKVYFFHCKFHTARWPEILSQMSPLEELKLLKCTPAIGDGLRQITQVQRDLKVMTYDLHVDSLFEFDLRSLVQMPKLETFSVTRCRVDSDDDFRDLSCHLRNLRCLALRFCANLSAAFMQAIAGLSSLQELSLVGSDDIDGTALEITRNGSCQLRKLELVGCPRIRSQDMDNVAGMSSLRDLTLVNLSLGSIGINCLKQGTLRLQTLNFVDCGCTFQDLKPWLEKQESLQLLWLGSSNMTDAERTEAQNLKGVLPSLKNVRIFESGLECVTRLLSRQIVRW